MDMDMDKDKALKQIFAKISQDPFAKLLGIQLLELKPGYSQVAMTVTEDMLNFHGIPHGGAIFSLADAAFAAAGNSHGQKAVALHMNISYLATVPVGTKLYAEAKEEKLGKRTALYHITVSTANNELIASCHGIVFRKEEKFLLREAKRAAGKRNLYLYL